MSENGPLATTVEDAALLLSVMAGRPALAEVDEPDRPLRIAVSTKDPLPGVARDREYREAVLQTGRLLAGEGHRVAAGDPPYATRHALPAVVRWFVGTAEEAEDVPAAGLQPRTRRHAAMGRLVRRIAAPSSGSREAWRRRLATLFDRFDVLVLPALAGPPIEAARWSERGWLANVAANARYAPFAGAWNLAGYPAAAVPAGGHSCGVPLSVQLVAPEGGEALLLSVARQLERLRPWRRHAPAPARVA
jgi:amidase